MQQERLRREDFKGSFCTSPKFVHLNCTDPTHDSMAGQGHTIQIKHLVREIRESGCLHCMDLRRRTIIAKAMDRYEQIKRPNDYIRLWTLGTSMDSSPGNVNRIQHMWKKFCSKMRTYSKRKKFTWDPLMNSLEIGKIGGKLHYHFAVRGYVPFDEVLNNWRNTTNELSNVNISKPFKDKNNKEQYFTKRTVVKMFAYIAKYIAKDGLRYYFMGKMLTQAKKTPYVSSENCEKYFSHMGEYQDNGWVKVLEERKLRDIANKYND
jgi:hypothetical protein